MKKEKCEHGHIYLGDSNHCCVCNTNTQTVTNDPLKEFEKRFTHGMPIEEIGSIQIDLPSLFDFIQEFYLTKTTVREAIEREEKLWKKNGGHATDGACPKCTVNATLASLLQALGLEK